MTIRGEPGKSSGDLLFTNEQCTGCRLYTNNALFPFASARLIRNFTRLQNYVAPIAWGSILVAGLLHDPSRYLQQSPLTKGLPPPLISDKIVARSLACFGLAYLGVFYWYFVRTGRLDREHKRDFSYEELYENTENYAHLDTTRRKGARFAA
jgi:hypothetical protein